MERKIKKSDQISLAIMSTCCGSPSDIMLPNFYAGMYEMDVFKLSAAGLVTEYEIKISRSDFFNDFKKPHKHDNLRDGKLTCNRFYFVTPDGLLKAKDIPEYVGWIEVSESGCLQTRKSAPILHKNKYTSHMSLAQSLAFRERIYRQRSRFYEYEVKRLETKCENLLKQIPC
jgi:hypothetical protein